MNLKVRFWLVSLALVGAVILSACGGNGNPGPSAGGTTVNALDTLKFEPATMTVPAGAAAQVVVKNTGVQQHNWVLVKTEDANRIATESLAKGGDATGLAGVLAGGKLIAAAGEETVSVNVPAGTYQYICTVAGHYQAGMVGTLTAQ
jgi:uncharacterized cupredoxin-like copper-binding protein